MATFCLENPGIFHEKSVIELGGGMTSLAGLFVAQTCEPASVLVTDGNAASVDNLKVILKGNKGRLHPDRVAATQLRWNNVPKDLTGKFDVVLCADCLFFDEGRPQLLKCLKTVMAPGGVALIFAPSRHGTFQEFVRMVCEDGTLVVAEHRYHYSDKVSRVKQTLEQDPRFDENLQFPIFLKICKPEN